MSDLQEEIEEASRGRKIPHDVKDKEALRKKKSLDVQKRFDKVNSEHDVIEDLEKAGEKDYARGSAKETLSDKITPH